MDNLSQYLKKFIRIIDDDISVKKIIIDVFYEVVRVNIEVGDIKITEGVLYIKSDPFLKNQLFIKKRSLLKSLQAHPSTKLIIDIR